MIFLDFLNNFFPKPLICKILSVSYFFPSAISYFYYKKLMKNTMYSNMPKVDINQFEIMTLVTLSQTAVHSGTDSAALSHPGLKLQILLPTLTEGAKFLIPKTQYDRSLEHLSTVKQNGFPQYVKTIWNENVRVL